MQAPCSQPTPTCIQYLCPLCKATNCGACQARCCIFLGSGVVKQTVQCVDTLGIVRAGEDHRAAGPAAGAW